MRTQTILGSVLAVALAATAHGQSFNIDIGPLVPHGSPAATFGAAAGQPGVWNSHASVGPNALVNLAGAPTGVTISATSFLPFQFNNLGTTGDIQALLDDFCDGATTYLIAGLAAGTYDVFTYVWAADAPGPANTSNVSVPGASSGTNPTLAGTSVLPPEPWNTPGHYALHTITIAAGANIVVQLAAGTGFVTSNGIQIRQVGGGGGCPGDTDGDSDVDADDLTNVILQWGNVCPCNADVDDDNDVDSDDLTVVILEWGTACGKP